MLFPRDPQATTTSIELVREHDGFPVVLATGLLGGDASGLPLLPNGPGLPLLGEHAHGRLTRPHLRGQRSGGRDWSTRFACEAVDVVDGRLRIELVDKAAALGLVTEAESVPGGALRLRHVLTNTGPDPYYLEGLEVVLPVPDHLVGGARLHRPARARAHPAAAPGHRRPLAARGPGRSTRSRRRHHGGAGHARLLHDVRRGAGRPRRLERQHRAPRGARPGHRDHARRWRAAAARARSRWRRARATPAPGSTSPPPTTGSTASPRRGTATSAASPAHPAHQPVVLNVWEAVYFDHDLDRLQAIADRAARIGVERFVLDDGWFHARRDDTVGLGDWTVDPTVWPEGLAPAGRPRARARDGVRAVDRAGDGQPRLRPLPRAPRLDPLRGRPGAAAAPQPAGARPGPRRGPRARVRADHRASWRRTRSTR